MNPNPRRLALAVLLALSSPAVLAQDPSGADADTAGQSLNLQGVDLRAFIQDVSLATGSTFILDPRVQGSVTITSQEALSPSTPL